MKKSIFIFIIVQLSTSSFMFAQEQEKLPLCKANNVYLHFNLHAENSPDLQVSDFKKLAPYNATVNKDFNGYQNSDNHLISYNQSNVNPVFSIYAGFKIRNKTKTGYKANPELRIGLTYIPNMNMNTTIKKTVTYGYDTLVSKQTGAEYYTDSTETKVFGFQYKYDQMRIHASLLYRTNPELRWQLYGGIGINAGCSLNSNVKAYEYVEDNFSKTTYGYSYEMIYDQRYEETRCKRNFGGSVFIPLGVDFRLGSKYELLRKTHLFYEISPSLTVTYVPELETLFSNTAIQFGTQLFGLRFSI